jgi:hypothetical protein
MSKKEQCKELMVKFFGPATGSLVDEMNEDEVVEKCRAKAAAFLGEDAAKEFDKL